MTTQESGQNGGASGAFTGWLAGEDGGASGLIQLAQAAPGRTGGEPIGQIDTLQGDATITRVDGTKVPAAKGVPVFQGDVVATGKSGNLGIVFADKSTFALGKDGQMTLDEMVYDPATSAGKMALNVAEGVFSFVSGQIAKSGPEAMMVKTPVATIGVRGTSVTGKAGAEGKPNSFSLIPDPNGQTGEATVKTSVGFETLNQPFASTSATSKFNTPSFTTILPASVVQKAFGDVTKTVNNYAATQNFAATGSAAQNRAAAQAYDQAIAQGKSPAEAAAQASDQAAQVAHVEKWEKIPVGPFANQAIAGNITKDILDAQTNKAQGGLGGEKDPLSAGRGSSADFGANAAAVRQSKDEGEKAAEQGEQNVQDTADDTRDSIVNAPPQTLAEMAADAFAAVNDLIDMGFGDFLGGFDFDAQSQDIVDTFDPGFAADVMGGALNDAIAPSVFNDDGTIKAEAMGAFLDAVLDASQAIFDQVMLDNFLAQADLPDFANSQDFDFLADNFDFFAPPPDYDTDFVPPTTNFDEVLPATVGPDNLVSGAGKNTMFLFGAGAFPNIAGQDTAVGGDGNDQLAFPNLGGTSALGNRLVLDVTATGSGTVTYYMNAAGTVNSTTINFSGIEQLLFSDVPITSSGGYIDGLSAPTSGDGSSAPSYSGDILVFPTMGSGEQGIAIAGTTGADTFYLDTSAANNDLADFSGKYSLIFGKDGGDTFNIQTGGSRLLIGGITSDDNNDTNSDGIPDANINVFSYDGNNVELKAYLFGTPGETSTDANVFDAATPNSSTYGNASDYDDSLWDVGQLTMGAGNDKVMVFDYVKLSALDGNAGADVLSFEGATSGIVMASSSEVADQYGVTEGIRIGAIANFESIEGSYNNDVLIAGVAHTLSGGYGDDALHGSNTADTFVGGDGQDTIDLAAASSDVDVIRYDASTDGGDTITWFETATADIISFSKAGFGLSGATGAVSANCLKNTLANIQATSDQSAYDVIIFTDDTGDTPASLSGADVEGALHGATTGAGSVFVVYYNGSNTVLAYDADTSTGNDGSGLTTIATLSSDGGGTTVDVDNLVAGNFAIHA